MLKSIKGLNQTDISIQNQSLIIEKIKTEQAISRAEVAKALGLSAPSVSVNIDKLLSKKIIKETGIGESRGGRRPVVIEYNYDYGYIIAISVKEEGLSGVISNLSGEINSRFDLEKNLSELTAKEVYESVDSLIDEITEKSSVDIKSVKCIVLALPGIIGNNEIRVSNIMPQLKGRGLYEYLNGRYEAEIIIKNDVNAKAVGEFWKLNEAGGSFETVVYISQEKTGIGSGIIIDGRLYEGNSFAAGEVGYMVLNTNISLEGEGFNGYLENITSNGNIVKQAVELSDVFGSDIGMRVSEGKKKIEILLDGLRNGDRVSKEIIDSLARHYAVSIHNVATILNPDIVVLGGYIKNMGDYLVNLINKYLERISIVPVSIMISSIDDMSELYGGLYFGLEYIEKNILFI